MILYLSSILRSYYLFSYIALALTIYTGHVDHDSRARLSFKKREKAENISFIKVYLKLSTTDSFPVDK